MSKVMEKQKLPQTPINSRFIVNGWYEHLEGQLRAGKLKLETLSLPTRLSLAAYTKAKREYESLKEG